MPCKNKKGFPYHIVICAAVAVVVVGWLASTASSNGLNLLPFLLFLLCPLSMFFCMKVMSSCDSKKKGMRDASQSSDVASELLYRCKTCGFHYRDSAMAEKCERWCGAHKSCNVEITKLSIEMSHK